LLSCMMIMGMIEKEKKRKIICMMMIFLFYDARKGY